MSIVLLASGGIDSGVIGAQAVNSGIEVWPVFVDYGQRAAEAEWQACQRLSEALSLHEPVFIDLGGFGAAIPSGLTRTGDDWDIFEDAYLPGRNLLLIVAGAAYAQRIGVSVLAIGLLDESYAWFPDQTREFVEKAQEVVKIAIDPELDIVAPLMSLNKSDVLELARQMDIPEPYSCHGGRPEPCGKCIACREIISAREK